MFLYSKSSTTNGMEAGRGVSFWTHLDEHISVLRCFFEARHRLVHFSIVLGQHIVSIYVDNGLVAFAEQVRVFCVSKFFKIRKRMLIETALVLRSVLGVIVETVGRYFPSFVGH